MSIEALTHRDDGSEVPYPTSRQEWDQWVSAGRTRNWALKDPLIDWLQLHGARRDYTSKADLRDYREDLDFTKFILEQGRAFEAGIRDLFSQSYEVRTIAQDSQDVISQEKANETFEAMVQGSPIIHQAVLWDAHHQTYGSPDFLVRSDILLEIFPSTITHQQTLDPAVGLGSENWHYLVVDSKFTTLHLNASGSELDNGASAPAYKAQLHLYNRMLGRLQGYEPPFAYLLGRGSERTQRGTTYRSSDALALLAPVPQEGSVANGAPIASEVDAALAWVRRVRAEGEQWDLLPLPSVPELYPNMTNIDDAELMLDLTVEDSEPWMDAVDEPDHHWSGVKKWLAGELKELTQLWRVGVTGRQKAHQAGYRRWDHAGLTPQDMGVTGANNGPILEQVLTVNTSNGQPVLPLSIEKSRSEWFETPPLEFYVDFEFCSDLNDDFSRLPEKGGQPLIFMVGCGHLEDGKWTFASFVADLLNEDQEHRIIMDWVEHMESVRQRLDPGNDTPRVIHWSHAEVTALETAYNSARERHGPNADWHQLNWYDFLTKVIRSEPVVVRGALGFGLKAVANALHSHGLIETNWADSPIDGLGAMVGAWRCDEAARGRGVAMIALPLMQEIARYNEVDCRVMMEIVSYLREKH